MRIETIRKWKRDALELNFSLQMRLKDEGPSAQMMVQIGTQLCNKVAALSHIIEEDWIYGRSEPRGNKTEASSSTERNEKYVPSAKRPKRAAERNGEGSY